MAIGAIDAATRATISRGVLLARTVPGAVPRRPPRRGKPDAMGIDERRRHGVGGFPTRSAARPPRRRTAPASPALLRGVLPALTSQQVR
jgi:hypothetical protein